MKQTRHFLVSGLAALSLGALMTLPASAGALTSSEQQRTDQGQAREQLRAGNQLSLREIERRVLPKMQGSKYIGSAYDSTARVYRLTFKKKGRVSYVDVDARTGRIIKTSR
ncbi:MAG: PepSY domain-containing protein [Erythrobacter sp.]